MLRKLSLTNFKGFKGKHTISLNELNALIGANSAGKIYNTSKYSILLNKI